MQKSVSGLGGVAARIDQVHYQAIHAHGSRSLNGGLEEMSRIGAVRWQLEQDFVREQRLRSALERQLGDVALQRQKSLTPPRSAIRQICAERCWISSANARQRVNCRKNLTRCVAWPASKQNSIARRPTSTGMSSSSCNTNCAPQRPPWSRHPPLATLYESNLTGGWMLSRYFASLRRGERRTGCA
jgi:hypothetical protein